MAEPGHALGYELDADKTMTVEIPADFPRDPCPGAVPGAQPKLLARKIGNKYVVGLTAAELEEHYGMCVELVAQLVPYCGRKQAEHPNWTKTSLLVKVRKALASKGWGLSEPEMDWIVARVADEMSKGPE